MLNTVSRVRLTEGQKQKLKVMGTSRGWGMSRVIRNLIDNADDGMKAKKMGSVQVSETAHATQNRLS